MQKRVCFSSSICVCDDLLNYVTRLSIRIDAVSRRTANHCAVHLEGTAQASTRFHKFVLEADLRGEAS